MKTTILNNYTKLGISLVDEAKEMLLNIDITEGYGLIYGHYCRDSQKWYCGQTVMIENPYDRWGLNGSHYTSGKFRAAIDKYGWNNFDHIVFGFYPISILSEMEKDWITKKDSFKYGYNSTEGGTLINMTGQHHSDTTKRKIGVSNGREVVRFRKKDGTVNEFVYDKSYLSASDAARDIGVYNNSQIIACCKGNRNTAKGFMWKYLSDVDESTILRLTPKNTVSYGMLNKKHSMETIEKIRKSNISRKGKSICKYDLNNNLLEVYESISSACRKNNFKTHSGISKCLCSNAKTAYGYKWRYKDDSTN